MKAAVFSAKTHDERFLGAAADGSGHELVFFESHLRADTARLAEGFEAVCVFVNDTVDRPALERLAAGGTRLVALRSAGFNHVDLDAAAELGITVTRVPAYSPEAVAEHTVALLLALERKIHRAHARVREGNLALEGLLGRTLHGKTAGIVGTGAIGTAVARILNGFGCRILADDVAENPEVVGLGGRYVEREQLLRESDVISLHCPLTLDTFHLIDEHAITCCMKPGAVLLNTSRGALIDTAAVIEGLKEGRLGGLGIDVYEEEGNLFFEDLSNEVIQDDVFSRLLTFPNVIVTGHQAFFTEEALEVIASTTVANLTAFATGAPNGNELTPVGD
jgi:D-lactate dehydrogenase